MSQTQPQIHLGLLHQCMLEDMHMRKLAAKTQVGYIRGAKKLDDFLGRSPHLATKEDLRRFQFYLVGHDQCHRRRAALFLRCDVGSQGCGGQASDRVKENSCLSVR